MIVHIETNHYHERKSLSIVKTMVDSGHLDADLYALFLNEGLYKKFDSIKKHV